MTEFLTKNDIPRDTQLVVREKGDSKIDINNDGKNDSKNDDTSIDDTTIDDMWKIVDDLERGNEVRTIVDENVCKNCECKDSFFSNGESMICVECGFENSGIIDETAEWRFYGSEDSKKVNPERCSRIDPLLPQSSLGSTMTNNSGKYHSWMRMQHWFSMPYKERSQYTVFVLIDNICGRCSYPKAVADQAKSYYKIISESRLSRSSVRKSLILACVYFACRNNGIPENFDELVAAFGYDSSKMTKGINLFINIINSYNKDHPKVEITDEVSSDNELVHKYSILLGLPRDFVKLATKVVEIVQKIGCCENNTPISMVVGCIYMITQEYKMDELSIDHISNKCSVSKVTIMNTYKKLKKYKELIFNNV